MFLLMKDKKRLCSETDLKQQELTGHRIGYNKIDLLAGKNRAIRVTHNLPNLLSLLAAAQQNRHWKSLNLSRFTTFAFHFHKLFHIQQKICLTTTIKSR